MDKKNSKLNILTEVGVFGELDIKDPTAKEVDGEEEQADINELISDAIQRNKNVSVN